MNENKRLAGVVGWPVSHSLSPRLHSFWLSQHQLPGAYVALPVEPGDFGQAIAALPKLGFAGVSVTVPHKQAAYAIASSLDDASRATAAVNTLLFRDGAVLGQNTDVVGFTDSLIDAFGRDAAARGPVTILGAGGAARAILFALQKLGAGEIRLVNRTQATADALAKLFSNSNIRSVAWGQWRTAFSGAGLLINTTSLGLRGKPPLDVPLVDLPKTAAVADIVYNPLNTGLLKAARTAGHQTMDGLGMLLHQAVAQFEGYGEQSVTLSVATVTNTVPGKDKYFDIDLSNLVNIQDPIDLSGRGVD